MSKFGVDSFIWSEDFSERDLWIIPKAKELGFEVLDIAIAHPETFPIKQVKTKANEAGIEIITTTTLNKKTNFISPDSKIRANGVNSMKKLVDINIELESRILGGVNYAAWGYLTGKPRTGQEWEWSIAAMREVAEYAKERNDLFIAVEPVNRFETHFLNIADDAVRYCKDVGTGNVKVHLDSFHMIREETSFAGAVKTCGKEYLGYVHMCESNRGIPGTGLVPWKEFFTALKSIGYTGPLVIESFDPGFEELNRLCAIWRRFAESGEALAVEGLRNLKSIAKDVSHAQEEFTSSTIAKKEIAIDSDNEGLILKKVIFEHLTSKGIPVVDLNYAKGNTQIYYPDIGYNLASEVRKRRFDRGILICGTGLGMAIVANKVEGIYAGTCHDVYSAERLRKSNNAQIITMGARVVGPELAKTIIDAWLKSEFQGGGSQPKVERMYFLEKKSFKDQMISNRGGK